MLGHNELGLALDVLVGSAERAPIPAAAWRELNFAVQEMGIDPSDPVHGPSARGRAKSSDIAPVAIADARTGPSQIAGYATQSYGGVVARAAGSDGRPLLLVDVDGVLQPVGRSVPPGYERFTDDQSDVVLCREHGVWLGKLAEKFDLVWATTWGATANHAIGARLGLPDLPHIELANLPRTGTRKLAAVAQYVGDRATAWIDDELYEDALSWAAGRAHPTLLRRPAPGVGLTEADVRSLEAFAAALD